MKKKMKKTIMSSSGKKPIAFKKGALHEQLNVPQGQPIPPGKKAAALAGKDGPLAKKRAAFAFKGALAAGRKTVAKKAAKKVARKFNAGGFERARRSIYGLGKAGA